MGYGHDALMSASLDAPTASHVPPSQPQSQGHGQDQEDPSQPCAELKGRVRLAAAAACVADVIAMRRLKVQQLTVHCQKRQADHRLSCIAQLGIGEDLPGSIDAGLGVTDKTATPEAGDSRSMSTRPGLSIGFTRAPFNGITAINGSGSGSSVFTLPHLGPGHALDAGEDGDRTLLACACDQLWGECRSVLATFTTAAATAVAATHGGKPIASSAGRSWPQLPFAVQQEEQDVPYAVLHGNPAQSAQLLHDVAQQQLLAQVLGGMQEAMSVMHPPLPTLMAEPAQTARNGAVVAAANAAAPVPAGSSVWSAPASLDAAACSAVDAAAAYLACWCGSLNVGVPGGGGRVPTGNEAGSHGVSTKQQVPPIGQAQLPAVEVGDVLLEALLRASELLAAVGNASTVADSGGAPRNSLASQIWGPSASRELAAPVLLLEHVSRVLAFEGDGPGMLRNGCEITNKLADEGRVGESAEIDSDPGCAARDSGAGAGSAHVDGRVWRRFGPSTQQLVRVLRLMGRIQAMCEALEQQHAPESDVCSRGLANPTFCSMMLALNGGSTPGTAQGNSDEPKLHQGPMASGADSSSDPRR
jgi:hypothetical protein